MSGRKLFLCVVQFVCGCVRDGRMSLWWLVFRGLNIRCCVSWCRGWVSVMSLVIFTVTFGELVSGSGHPGTNIHDQTPMKLRQKRSLAKLKYSSKDLLCLIFIMCYVFAIFADILRKNSRLSSKIYPLSLCCEAWHGSVADWWQCTHFHWTCVIPLDIGNSSVLAQTIAKPLHSSNSGQELLQILSNGPVDVFPLLPPPSVKCPAPAKVPSLWEVQMVPMLSFAGSSSRFLTLFWLLLGIHSSSPLIEKLFESKISFSNKNKGINPKKRSFFTKQSDLFS